MENNPGEVNYISTMNDIIESDKVIMYTSQTTHELDLSGLKDKAKAGLAKVGLKSGKVLDALKSVFFKGSKFYNESIDSNIVVLEELRGQLAKSKQVNRDHSLSTRAKESITSSFGGLLLFSDVNGLNSKNLSAITKRLSSYDDSQLVSKSNAFLIGKVPTMINLHKDANGDFGAFDQPSKFYEKGGLVDIVAKSKRGKFKSLIGLKRTNILSTQLLSFSGVSHSVMTIVETKHGMDVKVTNNKVASDVLSSYDSNNQNLNKGDLLTLVDAVLGYVKTKERLLSEYKSISDTFDNFTKENDGTEYFNIRKEFVLKVGPQITKSTLVRLKNRSQLLGVVVTLVKLHLGTFVDLKKVIKEDIKDSKIENTTETHSHQSDVSDILKSGVSLTEDEEILLEILGV